MRKPIRRWKKSDPVNPTISWRKLKIRPRPVNSNTVQMLGGPQPQQRLPIAENRTWIQIIPDHLHFLCYKNYSKQKNLLTVKNTKPSKSRLWSPCVLQSHLCVRKYKQNMTALHKDTKRSTSPILQTTECRYTPPSS